MNFLENLFERIETREVEAKHWQSALTSSQLDDIAKAANVTGVIVEQQLPSWIVQQISGWDGYEDIFTWHKLTKAMANEIS